jgi:tRNA threonylcarbamoyladenosine modification (KEOPS) complex Cgi121 subunit
MEEMKLEKVQRQIKETLLDKGANKGDEKFNEILCFLQRNEQSMEFLEIILNIRARLDYLKKLREKIKNEQLMSFKISNHVYQRFLNAKHSLQHDLIFSALFGCNIQV